MNKGCFGNPVPASAPEPGAAKAWVVFDGTSANANGRHCLILASYNVGDVVRNSLGNYTITFIRPFTSRYFCCQGTTFGANNTVTMAGGSTGGNKTIFCNQPGVGGVDGSEIHFTAWGEQA